MPQWIAACQADDIDPEDVIGFQHDGNNYAIYRSPDDVYYATDGHCSHEKTLLCDGLVMDGTIECPKHNGRFDYTSGKALGAPCWSTSRPTRSRSWTAPSISRSARRNAAGVPGPDRVVALCPGMRSLPPGDAGAGCGAREHRGAPDAGKFRVPGRIRCTM